MATTKSTAVPKPALPDVGSVLSLPLSRVSAYHELIDTLIHEVTSKDQGTCDQRDQIIALVHAAKRELAEIQSSVYQVHDSLRTLAAEGRSHV